MCALATDAILHPKCDISKNHDWSLTITGGLFENIAAELKRALNLTEPTADQERGFNQIYQRGMQGKESSLSLDTKDDFPETFQKIMEIDGRNQRNITFTSLCKYFLTELGLRVVMDVYGQDFDQGWAQYLVFFWLRVKDDFYQEITARHEDEKKQKNGDCPSFIKVREILAASPEN
jgi:hypothetical protein